MRGIPKSCLTPNCRNKTRGRRYCKTCSSRKYYSKYPLRRIFNNLKTHAKVRGKSFTITFEEFYELAMEVELSDNYGIEPHNLTVDRIDPSRGYEPGNIQFLTHFDNSYKGYTERRRDEYDESMEPF